ncbi:MAG TPA: thiamine pyrophosphate-binding protein [Dehalococcoidia bacterium]|nr:thiamine pyrophosphate-binding protein [Dehalococcoidia bacterium]
MAMVDGGDLVVRAIKQEGVDTIFTLCGGHVQAIYDACIDENVKVIDVRHEQVAGHAAEGWSRATRRCGVGVVTAGPGVTDCTTAIANAWHNKSPVLIIGGRSPLSRFEMGSLQDMDHTEMLKPITKWAKCVHETKRIPEFISMGFRAAMTGRPGPAFLEIPTDVLFMKVEESEVFFPQSYRPEGRVYPDPKVVRKAAEVLRNAERPVIMAGSAVYWSEGHEELRQLAELTRAPVYLNAMGRGSLAQDHELFFNRSRRNALTKADAILVIGTPLDFRLAYGKRFNPEAKTIQIDTDPAELGRNRDIDIPIEADAKACMESLAGELAGYKPEHEPWLAELREAEDKTRAQREEWMASDRTPIHPFRLCAEIANFVDENTIVVGDGGDIVSHASKILPVNQPGQWYDPGPFGTLGVGTGFCMAINSVYPNKRILMVNGDGAFGLNGFDFDTFVRFNIPVVSVVGNDRQWGQIIVGQKAMYGKDRVIASELGDNCRYDKIVEGMGGHGEYVTDPNDIRPAIERAFASGKPACVNVIMDQEPPGIMGGYEFM